MLKDLILHRNKKFEQLVSFLEKQGIIQIEKKGKCTRIRIKEPDIFKSIFSAIFLFYSLIPEDIPQIVAHEVSETIRMGFKFRFRTLLIPLEKESLDFFQQLVNLVEFRENSHWYKSMEELFNSFVILTIATKYYSRAAYPNTYVTEFKDEQELDGFLLLDRCCLLIETTFGRTQRDEEELGPHDHLKRKFFNKWFLEKVFKKRIFFLYLHTHELPDTKTVSYLKKLSDFRSVCLIQNTFLNMDNLRASFDCFYDSLIQALSTWDELNEIASPAPVPERV